jgi:predicted ribosome quality control (RQC) complex YloA/Tae2 family protein
VHNNYYFLRQLAQSLEKVLDGTIISECFSQNKEELIIRFETEEKPFFIKATLSGSFSCLSFPDNFHRARRNSINLFDKLIGQRVEAFRQFENERSFAILLSNNFSLLFKMHGNRSNIILFQDNGVDEIFKNNTPEDEGINLHALDRSIDWSYENFEVNQSRPEKIYFTFGKVVWKYLKNHQYDQGSVTEQWQAIQNVRDQLIQPSYSIREAEGKIFFSLLDVGKMAKQFTDPIQAINEFFILYTQQSAFTPEKSSMISLLKSKLHTHENYLDKTQKKINELEHDNNYKIWADLLMANLHAVPPGTERITVPDFYHDNRPTEIRLKRDLSPQKNAALFYKKSKNQQIELSHLQQVLHKKEAERDAIGNQLQQIEATQDLKSLRKLTADSAIVQEKEKQTSPLPYREVEFNHFKIWIGKNAQSNDILTLKYGYKEDLWLHAKDVAGSHVLIKHQAGKKIPKDVIERAAQLAAYYSKRKNDSLCPVSVTTKKYVRKRKGDPPGTVVIEREEVVMVEPSLEGK